jgi:hypothetical protein
MEIEIADQQILFLDNQITSQIAQVKAWEKKMVAFGTISKLGSFLSHPKDDDFELIYSEHRYQPFWDVVAKSRYIYDRNVEYQVKTSGSEVKSVTYLSKHYESNKGHISIKVTEHCTQKEEKEVFINAITGRNQPELASYLSFSKKQVTGRIGKIISKDSIMVPPQIRVSAVIRDMLSGVIKGIHADKIHEETVTVPVVNLYYFPVYAFQYRWKSKEKEAIVEIDAVTGKVQSGSRLFREYLGKVFDEDFLFNLGADAVGLLFPGGSIVVKAAKKYVDIRKDKNK